MKFHCFIVLNLFISTSSWPSTTLADTTYIGVYRRAIGSEIGHGGGGGSARSSVSSYASHSNVLQPSLSMSSSLNAKPQHYSIHQSKAYKAPDNLQRSNNDIKHSLIRSHIIRIMATVPPSGSSRYGRDRPSGSIISGNVILGPNNNNSLKSRELGLASNNKLQHRFDNNNNSN